MSPREPEATGGGNAQESSPDGPRRRTWSVQQRLLALIIGLMGFGLLTAGLVSFMLQYASLSERLDGELRQEIGELQQLANTGPAGDGPYDDVEALFETFMATAVTGDDESMLAIIDGVPAIVSGGDRQFDVNDEDVVRAVRQLDLEPGRARTISLRTQGTELRVLAADVRLAGEDREGTFVVAIDLGSQRAEITRQAGTYALVSLATLALAATLGSLVLGRLLRPLHDLRRATAEVSTESLWRRVEVEDADNDVAELAVRFNQMLERLDRGVQEQRTFLDDAAHELRTPLTIIRGNAELMDAEDPEDVRSTQTLVLDEVDRMQRLVDDLLMLARSQRPDFVRRETVEVTELTMETMDRITALGPRAWRLQADAEGQVVVDRQRIIQAVVQLAANAVKFSEEGSVIEMVARWVPLASHEGATARAAGAEQAPRYLSISIRDEGRGIPEDEVDSIFSRFARAENAESEEGSGLGLAIVEAIAHAHGGAAGVASAPGVGSTFTVWLPATTPD